MLTWIWCASDDLADWYPDEVKYKVMILWAKSTTSFDIKKTY